MTDLPIPFPRLVTLALFLLSGASAQAQSADLARLSWLGGCWKSAGGEAGSEEQWMPAAGETMLGMGRTVKQGKAVAHEFMQIRVGIDGALAFLAQPSGRPPETFPVLRISDAEVVFENLQHDFPQRVAYKLEGATRLAARIEGMRNGTLRVIDFPMDRVSCDARLAGPAK
ncbi:MAG: hypothetical protein JWQ07_3066 [Ramlibacter sp.]|nr:hypothetical protein [Ramlibacter sp.]